MEHYHFDLDHYQIRELMVKWSKLYPHQWLPLAVIEAIYEGRIKAVSVEQILNFWHKKGEIIKRFNSEFERLITSDLDLDKFTQAEIQGIFNYANEEISLPTLNHDCSKNNSSYVNNCHQDSKSIVEYQENFFKQELITNFEPLEDYSNCFHKLKGFAKNLIDSEL